MTTSDILRPSSSIFSILRGSPMSYEDSRSSRPTSQAITPGTKITLSIVGWVAVLVFVLGNAGTLFGIYLSFERSIAALSTYSVETRAFHNTLNARVDRLEDRLDRVGGK